MHAFFCLLLSVLSLAPSEVSVTTADGTVLTGEVRYKTIKLETDFGSATIDMDKIGRIEFGEPDVVVTVGGTELRGEVDLRSLKIKTAEGSKTVRREDLVSLSGMVEGRPFGVSDFSGEWSTSFGPMKLKQTGTTVEGTYGFRDESTIEGRIEDGRLEFRYGGAGGSGEGYFELWDDGRTFVGQYKVSDGERFWGGYRLQPKVAEARPGEVTEGQTKSMLNYYLHVPEDYDPKREYPAIAFFHGSNMSSRAYVDTMVSTWPELAADYLIVGFDGERLSSRSADGQRYFNATYINYSGHEVGEPWRYRQTPGLVADALRELQEALPIDSWMVGGHSQGGFLTYAVVMYYPELVRGAFPMACSLLVQCEPSNFTDEDVRAAQRAVALAPIHGENDDVVNFSSGVYCHEAMEDDGFPMLRFFTHPSAGHSFMHLPVEEAVRWLERVTDDDPDRLLAFAEEAVKDGRYRDAVAALRNAEAAGASKGAVNDLHEKVDDELAADAKKLAPAIRKNANGRWVADFWKFRAQFAFARGAQDVMSAYAEVRAEHQPKAEEIYWKARNEEDDAKRKAMYMEIVDRYWGSRYYPRILRWYE